VSSSPRHEPLFDVHPRTGASIEVFYADRRLETFGRCGAGWFWWLRRRGFAPAGTASGPFPTSYAAYRHALGTALGTNRDIPIDMTIKSEASSGLLAEREGFEPPIGLHLCRISSAVHSTTLPPLQGAKTGGFPPLVGPSSRRRRRVRQGAGREKFPLCRVKPMLGKSGTARRDKNRRSRVASLKLRPGSAGQPERRFDGSDRCGIGNAISVLT
jgi:hypothetical protein